MTTNNPQFVRGEFLAYKAITKVHLGAIEDDLQEGEVVLYDGTTMRRGPDDVQLATLRSAIKVGWLIPEDEEATAYVPKAAGVEIRPAESRGRDRGPAMAMGVVEDEEREVGTLDQVRGPNAPPTHHAKHAGVEIGADGKARPLRGERGRSRRVVESSQEGEVVGRLRTSGKAGAIDVAKDGSRERNRIRNASGKQHVGLAGDNLEDVLPGAASSGVPRGGVAGEGDDQESADERASRLAQAKQQADARKADRMGQAVKSEAEAKSEDPDNVAVPDNAKATVSGGGPAIRMGDKATVENTSNKAIDASVTVTRGSDSVGLGSDGDVVGTIGQIPRGVQPPVAREEITFEGDGSNGPAEEPAAEEPAANATATEADVPPEAIVQAKIEMIRQFVPGFEWDMSIQWAKRAKIAVAKYGDNMPVINAILSIETPTVRKHIMKRLYSDD